MKSAKKANQQTTDLHHTTLFMEVAELYSDPWQQKILSQLDILRIFRNILKHKILNKYVYAIANNRCGRWTRNKVVINVSLTVHMWYSISYHMHTVLHVPGYVL